MACFGECNAPNTSGTVASQLAGTPCMRDRTWPLPPGMHCKLFSAEPRPAVPHVCRPRREVIQALEAAQRAPKPPLSAMFEDVYARMPPHLEAQASPALEASLTCKHVHCIVTTPAAPLAVLCRPALPFLHKARAVG